MLVVTMPSIVVIYDLTRSACIPAATINCSNDEYIASSAFVTLLSQQTDTSLTQARCYTLVL